MAIISDFTLPKGSANMTLFGTRNDDGTVTLPSLPFNFPFSNSTINSLYVSGNSWLGIGSATEHLKINRRDASYNNLYYASEIEYGVNTFRIRFEGNSIYNSWNLNDLFWEATFFEDGVIVVVIEKSNNTGDDSFTCPDGTIITTKFENGKSYVIVPQNEEFTSYLIVEGSYIPSENRYLMIDENVVKSYITDENSVSSWVKIADLPLTVDTFLEYGISVLPSDLSGLTATPKLMYYTDNSSVVEEKSKYKLEAMEVVTSKPKLILQKEDYVIERGQIIKSITVLTSEIGGNIRIALSFDGGNNFKTLINGDVLNVDINNSEDFLQNGMVATDFDRLDYSRLNGLINGSLRFAYILDKPLLTDVCKLKVVKIKFEDV